jgi:hypothetical protein
MIHCLCHCGGLVDRTGNFRNDSGTSYPNFLYLFLLPRFFRFSLTRCQCHLHPHQFHPFRQSVQSRQHSRNVLSPKPIAHLGLNQTRLVYSDCTIAKRFQCTILRIKCHYTTNVKLQLTRSLVGLLTVLAQRIPFTHTRMIAPFVLEIGTGTKVQRSRDETSKVSSKLSGARVSSPTIFATLNGQSSIAN